MVFVTLAGVCVSGDALPVQVNQRAAVRRRASAEDRTEIRAHCRAVKRAVVKSDGDETEVPAVVYICLHYDRIHFLTT